MKRGLTGITLVGALLFALVGCSGFAGADMAHDEQKLEREPDNWVVISYEHEPGDVAFDAFEALLETEVAADEALVAADQGWIDGNEIGKASYDLYFNGYDHDEMWITLEPIFAAAPFEWTRVELRVDLQGPPEIELTR